jgi:hypothetical protein
MLMEVEVAAEVVEQAVTVPSRARCSCAGQSISSSPSPDGTAAPHTGAHRPARPDRIEIREGLETGTEVIVEARQALEDGARVAAAPPAHREQPGGA